MKNKILKLLSLFCLNTSISFAAPIFDGSGLGTEGVKESLPGGVSASDRLGEVILGYVDFFMPFLGIFAFVALVYAGFLYVTSAANEENADKAKNIIIYVVLGVVLVFMSYSIVSLFFNII